MILNSLRVCSLFPALKALKMPRFLFSSQNWGKNENFKKYASKCPDSIDNSYK